MHRAEAMVSHVERADRGSVVGGLHELPPTSDALYKMRIIVLSNTGDVVPK